MKLFGALAIVSVFATVPVLSQTARAQSDSSALQVPVDLVLLDVSVQDKDGQPVRNLQSKDFRVYDDRIEQSIAAFGTEESSVTWGLVLDRSSSMEGMIKEVQEAAVNVLDQGTKDDEMFIMTFNSRAEIISGLTSDRHQLANSLVGLQAEGNTGLYDAVDAALDYIKQGKYRKKVLVVVTDGGDNRSRVRFSQLINRVKESDVLIYTVGMYGSMTSNPTEVRSSSPARQELQQLAELTGAYAHFPIDPEKCREVMDKIAREVSEHYTIGYYPANQTRDGRWRKLKVVVDAQPNAKHVVHARSGYYAPGPAPSAQLNSESPRKRPID
ncbi:MAG TPA: VWA domain-containing protein [Terriglobia bacterium]|nr:VWA domain-containing protein [Terriglobia bacterium]